MRHQSSFFCAMMKIFSFGAFQLEYQEYGTGEEVIFCFHGFGRPTTDFEIFLPLLRKYQRMVSIALFAHAHSVFPAERIVRQPLQPKEWKEILGAFCLKLGIHSFHLLGYSIGARVVFITMLQMPQQVKSVLLLAPDGLKINPLYRFASSTRLGHSLYLAVIRNPSWLFRTAGVLNKMGLLSDKLLRFVHVHLDTLEKRQQVHDAWMIYRKFFPDPQELASLINKEFFSFHMIFGKYDEVIKPKLGIKLQRKLQKKNQLLVVDMGHRLLQHKVLESISKEKWWPNGINT